MLTPSDLKAIKKIVREEVEIEVKDSTRTVESQIRFSRMQVQNDLRELDPKFRRKYLKANVRIRNKVDECIRIFVKNPNDPFLNNHKLRREWVGHRSIDITSDWRVIYKEIIIGDQIIAYFVDIGIHKELYKPARKN